MLIIGQQLLIECVCLDYIGWKRCRFPVSLVQSPTELGAKTGFEWFERRKCSMLVSIFTDNTLREAGV